MQRFIASIGLLGLLLACSGGDDATQGAQADATAPDAPTAASTAESVHATILALRRGHL